MEIDKFIHKKPYLIAGPCSAESEEQLLETAHSIKEIADVFRAGIWKPRTKPNSFEGVGEKGLQWLQKIQKETGLKIATEIATPQHVELALDWCQNYCKSFLCARNCRSFKGSKHPRFCKKSYPSRIKFVVGRFGAIK